MKRKILVITGSRAEYSLLKPLLEEILHDTALSLQLAVTGMHLSPEFGLTYQLIENDGFSITEKIDIELLSDSSVGIARSMGLGLEKFAKTFKKFAPDIVVILGDRFEILAAATAAVLTRIPLAHIHGGEITEGSLDDTFRHCITKMSHLHFAATEVYRKRIIQLGENPSLVYTVGSLGLDALRKTRLLSRQDLEDQYGIPFNKHNLLVAFHPATCEVESAEKQFHILLEALSQFNETTLIFTKANADLGGRIINTMIDEYVRDHQSNTISFTSLGQPGFWSVMNIADAVVGNSSSGIIEAPSLRTATVNIGNRQKGRIRSKSVIDCEPVTEDIIRAVLKALSKEFSKTLQKTVNPYDQGDTSKQIKEILKKSFLESILNKKFFTFNFV